MKIPSNSMQPYPPEVEQQMHRFYQSLSEKDQRRYAAVEAWERNRNSDIEFWRLVSRIIENSSRENRS